ncbi:nucleoside triphosphate pyrophosphohydrolase [Coralloluteibacterium stylophorae]|uniref:Nucleoside triphosphate pyrophosphohydrolase n=1 Tax=Coralloluteibacterium stylophorae TaxID=1776034 RepID=A0A8J7VT39_9GAMM|nr:nucleoside triphosphate pyrophosphohydrolase [Coralloluteibacterium stylophorae]MBS7456098.1 nucleoside triphosphate pyrophosphohydrolase [Coralloluteibacterium stylophorae]
MAEARPDPGDIAGLLAVMARLRDPERGCPWDLQQRFETIAPYTIEEAYEVADAIDRGDLDDLRDELGDLLLQVVFHARMAEEAGRFGFAEVVAGIRDKMLRRHPHVFGDARAGDAAADWEAIKRRERRDRGAADTSALAGIGRGIPEWQRALKLQARAARTGFEWPAPGPVLDKLAEELAEVRAEFDAVAAEPEDAAAQDRLEDELGDVLFVAVNLARHGRVDPGTALRRANAKFERRFRRMEALAAADGLVFEQLGLAEQDALWARAKREE